MEIDLRQHQDGSYVLKVRTPKLTREVDITEIVRDIVVDKLRDMQGQLDLEKEYRNWLVDSAQETSKSLSTVATRYEAAHRRLKESTQAVQELISLWQQQKPVPYELMMRLRQLAEQNDHYLENDSGLKKLLPTT